MRRYLSRSLKLNLMLCATAFASAMIVNHCQAAPASFGIHFSGPADDGGWGPYYLNQVGAHGAGPYPSAFGVPAANWYEPGSFAQTAALPGAPTSVNFQSPAMGAGSVSFSWSSAHAEGSLGYTFIPYGFSNANRFVMQKDENGVKLLDANGHYIPAVPEAFEPDNGVPPSGEHAVLAGGLFATDGVEYAPTWPKSDIVVTITGLNSIASGYKVRLLAAAQNGDVVEGFTSAVVTDNASHTQTIDFELLPDRPSYWSPHDPDPANKFVSVAGKAESTTTFTGNSVEIRLSGGNEYFNEEFEFVRTLLSGVIIDYESIATPSVPGDYDHNGLVEQLDYTKWRTQFGTAGPDADGNGNGVVDAADYVVWRNALPAGNGSAAGAAVPEPTGLLAAISAICTVFTMNSNRGRRRRAVR